ncbi:MAG TPA: hypothetical protein VLH56_08950 [Dissulfurispiraceae bacterium]|nr:hypothetical protein [Dissulfurispiraceae bacterium]
MTTNRKTHRDALEAAIKAFTGLADEAGGIPHVFSELIVTFGGLSPCVTIENGGWSPDMTGDNTSPDKVRFIIGFWRRTDTRGNAEDALDTFAGELIALMKKSYNARYYQDSMPFYELIEGVEYRGEYHFVELEEV